MKLALLELGKFEEIRAKFVANYQMVEMLGLNVISEYILV